MNEGQNVFKLYTVVLKPESGVWSIIYLITKMYGVFLKIKAI
jgi:hypothetical protein